MASLTQDLSLLLIVHLISAVGAIIAGAAIFLMRKGTGRHRAMGISYMAAMLVTVVSVIPVEATVLRIGDSRFGFFHLLILVAFGSVAIGTDRLLRWRRTREKRWLRGHQIHLTYSYAGLIMAGFSQLATNPRWQLVEVGNAVQFWTVFAAVNAAIYFVAMYLIQTRIAKGDPLRWIRAQPPS